jgi:hypothetical protein
MVSKQYVRVGLHFLDVLDVEVQRCLGILPAGTKKHLLGIKGF